MHISRRDPRHLLTAKAKGFTFLPMKTAPVFALVLSLLLATAAAAGYDLRIEHVTARAEGLFLTFNVQSLNTSDDLRRNLTLWHIEKAFFIPRLENPVGFRLGLGIGGKTAYGSWEIRYSLALPKAEISGETGTLQFHNLEINGRSFIIKSEVFHPYGMLGIDLPLLVMKNGSLYKGQRLTATYAGLGINAGGGVIIDLGRSAFINLEALYRFTVFLYAYGEGKGRDINYMHVGTTDGPAFGRLLRASSFGLSVSLGFML
jgi:hypothetical protein